MGAGAKIRIPLAPQTPLPCQRCGALRPLVTDGGSWVCESCFSERSEKRLVGLLLVLVLFVAALLALGVATSPGPPPTDSLVRGR